MATKRRTSDVTPVSTPSQQDEADIVKEIGATPANDGSGDLLADETKVREAGAVDAESIRENRRVDEIVNKKRAGQKDVQFNSDDILEKYEGVIKYWPANTIDIIVKRVTGTPVEWMIQTRPRSGAELYTAILARHGRCEEAEYDVRLRDCGSAQRRGTGRITMPDTRDAPPSPSSSQGQPPMNAPPAASAASSTDPVAMMRAMFDMVQQIQRPQTPSTQPPPPPQTPSTDPMAMMRAMFDMVQQIQHPPQSGPAVPQAVPAPAPASFPGQSTDPMAMMKAMFEMVQQTQPSTSSSPTQPATAPTDPVAMMRAMFDMVQQTKPSTPPSPQPAPASTDPMAMMRAMFEMIQQMQPAQPAQPSPQPQMMGMPPVQPPPGTMFVPGFGFVPVDRLFSALSGTPAVSGPGPSGPGGPGPGPYRGPYGGPRPYYGGSQGHGPQEDPRYPPPQQPPSRPKTAAEEFKDAASVIDMAMSLAERFRPQAPAAEPSRTRGDDDDNPVKVMDVGGWPVIINKDDGSARKWETGVANIGNVLKWVSEQREAIQKANAEREGRQRPRQQSLPPGFVEVGPGYQPPRGYVAVPVDELPPPPAEMPPPITQQEEPPPPPPNRTWGVPPMPGDGG